MDRQQSRAQAPSIDEQTLQQLGMLFDLVRAGETEQLARLFSMGLVANILDSQGNSLLMLAVYHGHCSTAELIMEQGGDPTLVNDRGQSPLAAAAFRGDMQCVEMLLRQGAEVDFRPPGGKTALMHAAMFERLEMLEYLLARGADAQLKTADGLRAVDLARAMGAERSVAALERAGLW